MTGASIVISGVSIWRVVSGRSRVISERARGRAAVAHVRQLMLDQGMVQDEQVREARILFHCRNRLLLVAAVIDR
jgi:hypothetical protein